MDVKKRLFSEKESSNPIGKAQVTVYLAGSTGLPELSISAIRADGPSDSIGL